MTGNTIKVDGGKHLTVRGQLTWVGMNDRQKQSMFGMNARREFEVGESTEFLDFCS